MKNMDYKLLTLATIALINLAPVRGQDFSAIRRAEASAVPPASVTLGALMVSNSTWTDASKAGFYTLEARPGGAVRLQHALASAVDVCAALQKDNTMYVVEASLSEGFHYTTYSSNTWTRGSREEIDIVNVPSDLTYDAVTGRVYGGFWDDENMGFYRFCNFSLTSAEATDIKGADRDERDFIAITDDGKGTIYALFGYYNYLVTVDPRTGAVERIGRTGLSPDLDASTGKVSSMCYDSVNDRLLATVYQEEGYGANKVITSGLYEINKNTAETTLLYKFDGNACFAGLYVYSDKADATAPAAPGQLKVNFAEGSLSTGNIEFVAPATTVGGSPIAGAMYAIISINGTEQVLSGIKAGEHVTVSDVVFSEGANTVKVTMADNERRGETATLSFLAGEDIPSAPGDVRLAVEGGAARLSWTAPAGGAAGGAIIPANLRYKVTRYPDARVVADNIMGTSFADKELNASWRALYYTVSCYNSKGSSEAIASNKCPAAGALTVPFSENFDTADDFDIWTVVNTNGGSTWVWDKSGKRACYEYNRDNLAGDDWLITPPLALEGGRIYKLGYSYRAYNARYPETFEVMFGNGATPQALSTRLVSHENFTNTTDEHAETAFSVESDGTYNIGFHNISAPKMWYMYLDNVTVEAVDSRVPAAVSDLVVIPADKGALEAEISFTVPARDAEGSDLVSVTGAKIYRSGVTQPVATLGALTPGEKVSATDKTISESGLYTYSVVCINEVGESVAATASAFVGVDAPGAVLNLSVSEDASRHAALAWDTPDKGASGGWFDASQLSYRIVRSDGVVLEEAYKGNTYTDTRYTAPSSGQENVWYLVTPYCGTVKGAYAQTSEIYLFGNPYTAPITETFAGADMICYPWMAQSDNAVYQAWTLDPAGVTPATADQSGDRGVATFHSVGEPAGTVSRFYSPKFDISALENPSLSFWMYHSPSVEGNAALELHVSAGNDNFVATGLVIRRDAAETDGWIRHSVSLDSYRGARYVRFEFTGIGDAVADIYLDNIAVEDAVDTDAALTELSAPRRIAAGEKAEVEVTVLNAGNGPVNDVLVTVSDGSAERSRATVESLAPGQIRRLNFPIVIDGKGSHALTASVALSGDMRAENNSQTAVIEAVDPVVGVPSGLTVQRGETGSVNVSWKAPSEHGAVTDDVESYAPWAIDGIGEWTMHDGDYDLTYYISKDAGEYEHATDRKAFQVLDVSALGIDIWDEGKAHSGKRLFAAMAAINYVNDDWLISPRLNGAEQWISFYARSFTTQKVAPERMRVLYSTTDTDPANFKTITEKYVELDGIWREFRYYLPAGSRYFAVNCVSDGSFAMFVDDLSFNDLTVPSWAVTGYEVLRDGVVVGEASGTSFTDTGVTGDKATYTVRALYGEHGAGPDSEKAEIDMTSIETIETGAEPLDTFTPAGVRVEGNPQPGIYIIRYSDGSVRKVSVR